MKNICIVGNKPLPLNCENCSASIDSMDLVVRISKMDHMILDHDRMRGNLGKRVDWLLLEPNDVWEAMPDKNIELAHMASLVFVRNDWYDRKKERLIQVHGFSEEKLICIPSHLSDDKAHWTTAGLAVFLMHVLFPFAKIHLYCLDFFKRESFLRGIPWHASSTETSFMRTLFLNKQLIPRINC